MIRKAEGCGGVRYYRRHMNCYLRLVQQSPCQPSVQTRSPWEEHVQCPNWSFLGRQRLAQPEPQQCSSHMTRYSQLRAECELRSSSSCQSEPTSSHCCVVSRVISVLLAPTPPAKTKLDVRHLQQTKDQIISQLHHQVIYISPEAHLTKYRSVECHNPTSTRDFKGREICNPATTGISVSFSKSAA